MSSDQKIPSNELREAFAALLDSDGWRFFTGFAASTHGAERVLQDLLTLARENTDMATLGSLTAARLNACQAVDQLLALPREILMQIEQEGVNATKGIGG
jgi:hypothetical protein